MSSQIYGAPGVYSGRTITPLNILATQQGAAWAPSFYYFDGTKARDPDNSPTSLLRAGLFIGKVTSGGGYANSIIGLTTAALGGGQTTLSVTPQAATELVRRVGASGTFNLTGEASPGGAARIRTITYSAVNTTTGAVTITADAAGAVSAVNQVEALPFVDSTGSGTFTLTVEGITTGAITYSATAATLVTNINTALNAAFGTSAIVASGASLAAIILTFSGTGYTNRPITGHVTATLLTGATGFTAGGSTGIGAGNAGNSTTTTLGVVAVTADEGEFVAASLVQPTDGSQSPLTIFDQKYGTDVRSSDGTDISQPLHRFLTRGSLISQNLINYSGASAGSQAWLKAQLAANGTFFDFGDNR